VYVKKRADGFSVHELGNGTSNATFDYKVIAKRAGFADVRMERFGDTPGEPARSSQPSMYVPTEGLGDPTDGKAVDEDEVRARPVRTSPEPAGSTSELQGSSTRTPQRDAIER
jgi:hypothetical protein